MTVQDINYWLGVTPFELSENDSKSLLTESNATWPPHTWDELKAIIAGKDLSMLTRWPTDMRKYVLWRKEMKTRYPDIAEFIVVHRLNWPQPTDTGFEVQSAIPFDQPADYCIRRNDWPYALEDDVSHIVVWLKTRIDVDDLGDPTPESARLITNFVDRTFTSKLTPENSRPDTEIIWFKNRVKWQTVRSLEHVHVLIKGADDSFIEQCTGQTQSDTIGNAWSAQAVSSNG